METVFLLRRFAISLVTLCSLCVGSALADQTHPELDELFEDLAKTSDPRRVSQIETRILDAWRETDSDSIDLLMNRAIIAQGEGDYDTALIHYDDVVDLAPDYAEGWNRRATLLFVMERYDESIRDIERTVSLEPRHFGAWSGLGKILLELDDEKNALEAYRKALDVNPHLDEIADLVKKLTPDVEGRGI